MKIVLVGNDGTVLNSIETKELTGSEAMHAIQNGLEESNCVECETCDCWLPGELAVERNLNFYCGACAVADPESA